MGRSSTAISPSRQGCDIPADRREDRHRTGGVQRRDCAGKQSKILHCVPGRVARLPFDSAKGSTARKGRPAASPANVWQPVPPINPTSQTRSPTEEASPTIAAWHDGPNDYRSAPSEPSAWIFQPWWPSLAPMYSTPMNPLLHHDQMSEFGVPLQHVPLMFPQVTSAGDDRPLRSYLGNNDHARKLISGQRDELLSSPVSNQISGPTAWTRVVTVPRAI